MSSQNIIYPSSKYSVFEGTRRLGLSVPLIVTSLENKNCFGLFTGSWLLLCDFISGTSATGEIRSTNRSIEAKSYFTDDFIEEELVNQAEVHLEYTLSQHDASLCQSVYYSSDPLSFQKILDPERAHQRLRNRIVSGSDSLSQIAAEYPIQRTVNQSVADLIFQTMAIRERYRPIKS